MGTIFFSRLWQRLLPTTLVLCAGVATLGMAVIPAIADAAPVKPLSMAIDKWLVFDPGKPGQDSDEIENHRDFAWKKNWQESPVWGGRAGYVDTNGTLRVQTTLQPGGRSRWVAVAHSVRQFQLMDWRLAVLKKNGTLLFAEGPLDTPLRAIAQKVDAFQLTHNRIGILQEDGAFLLKEYGFKPQKVASGVKGFQVLVDRVAVLGRDGSLWLHDGGSVGDGFGKLADNVESFQIERGWVGFTQRQASGGNSLFIGKGPLRDASGKQLALKKHAGDVADFEFEMTVELSNKVRSRLHLAVVDSMGRLQVGESTLDDSWVPLKPISGVTAKKAQWAGRHLLIKSDDGSLQIGKLRDDSGDFEQPVAAIGKAALAEINQEGRLVLGRNANELRLIEARQKNSSPQQSLAEQSAPPSRSFDLNDETVISDAEASLNGIGNVQLSSWKPAHARRAMVGKQ